MQTVISRRSFVKTLGAGGLGALTFPEVLARGHEAFLGEKASPAGHPALPAAQIGIEDVLHLDSNENPNGPGSSVLEAMTGGFAITSRYPDRPEEDVRGAVARRHRIAGENVLMGCGSTEILRMAVDAFCSQSRALVTATPTFEWPEARARIAGFPVISVPVDAALRLDLRQMAAAAPGSGLIYVCNPNNPTATAHSAHAVQDFVRSALKIAPETTILIDEAYFEYVDDAACASALPLAMESPRVIVCRTFSKIFGMAGLRVGYAVGDAATLGALERHKLPSGVNALAAIAAVATVGDLDHVQRERALTRSAKDFTLRFLEAAGYKAAPSETNFIMVDIRRDSREFRDACRARGVHIGRPFPHLAAHARISIGTMDEMHRAVGVFREVLAYQPPVRLDG